MNSIYDCYTLNNGMKIPCMGFGTYKAVDFKTAIEAGYRYFDFQTAKMLTVTIRGNAKGCFVVRDGRGGPVVSCIPVSPSQDWTAFSAPLNIGEGKKALYFTYEGEGAADFIRFRFD